MTDDSAHSAPTGLTEFAAELLRSRLLVAIGVGLCCAVGLLLTAGSPLNQAGEIDAFVYVGYIHDYHGLLERFGPRYYSERIAYIYPERVLAYFFGLEGGYFILRFVALTSAAAAVFAIGRRFYAFAPALFAAVWLSFTPWLSRSLLRTYVDGFAVVYVLAGTALLFVPTRRRQIFHLAAGAAFALAVDCNLFVIAICGLLGPGWAFFYRREGVMGLARAVTALAAGFFVTYLILAFLLYAEFPGNGFFSFGLATVRVAIAGEDEIYFTSLSSLIWRHKSFMLLIPFVLMLGAFLSVVRRGSLAQPAPGRWDFEVVAVSYLACVICFALVLHFAFHDAWLSVHVYRTYFVPGCVLALIVLAGEAQRQGGRIFGDAAVYVGIALTLSVWLALPVMPRFAIAFGWPFWLVTATVVVGAALTLRRTGAAAPVLVASAVLLSLCVYTTDNPGGEEANYYGQIRQVFAERQESEWDVYRGAIFLQRFVNADVGPKQSVGFWYSGNRELPWKWLNSIQSTYLWGYTRVFPPVDPGMPLIDEDFRSNVAGLEFLVLLGLSEAEANVAVGALAKANLPFDEVKRSRFQGKTWGYTAVLMRTRTNN